MEGRPALDPKSMRSRGAGLIVVLALGSLSCANGTLPRPEASYRAIVEIETRDPETGASDKVELIEYYGDGMRRREGQYGGEPIVVIDRSDLRVRWTLDPESRSYVETPHARLETPNSPFPDPFGFVTRTRFEPIGNEKFADVETTMYEVEADDFRGRAWLRAQQIPFQFVGKLRDGDRFIDVQIRYTDLIKAAPEIQLFDVPPTFANYEKRKQPRATRPASDQGERSLEEAMRQRAMVPPPPPPAMY